MSDNSPIFVVGMNGSGTGALTRGIAQHQLVYAFPGESRAFVTFMQRYPRPIDGLTDDSFSRLLSSVTTYDGLARWNGGQRIPLRSEDFEGRRSLAALLNEAFLYFAAREKKQRWCEKTPSNAYHIESLVSHFPDAKIVHIIRDGRDAALSFQRRFGYQPMLSVLRWKRLIREARMQGANVGDAHYLEVRYEDLTANPEDVLRRVCSFLNLDFQASMLAPNRPTQTPMLAPAFVANSEKWRSLEPPSALARMEDIAGELLQELGYSVVNTPGDASIPRWLLTCYQIQDLCWTVVRYAKKVFSGGGSISAKIVTFSRILKSSLQALMGRH